MNRRQFVIATLGTTLAAPLARAAAHPEIEVYKSPTCGCCSAWVEHMKQAGFTTTAHDVDGDVLNDIKERSGITYDTASCHTALVEGYVVEGHVPAEDVLRLLDERPQARGLAAPGMPIGSPGMEMGEQREPYATLLIGPDGKTEVFARHNGA